MELRERHKNVIESLGELDGQRFTDLHKHTKLDQDTLSTTLKELIEGGIIKQPKTRGRYFINIERTDDTIKTIKEKYGKELSKIDESMEELKENEFPFIVGRKLLSACMFDLQKLTLKKNNQSLNDVEKYEYEKLIKQCNETIEKTFKTLYDISPNQTLSLQKYLDTITTKPKEIMKNFTNMNRAERRRNDKVSIKIEKYIKN